MVVESARSARNPPNFLILKHGIYFRDMAKKTAQQKAAEENDANIMATNDSSIVSKRSAELVYHQEPHFIKYFVQRKKVRRSPLISRGYWLRMKAVETVVRRFLDESLCRKVIVNLGAGYDALPFDMLAKESELCKNATFVDVDYPQLLQRKYQMIKAAPALMDLLGDVSISDGETVLLRSKQYMLAGCDLNRPEQLKDFLLQNFEQGSHFLFVAEVSIAYMETGQANDVIALTATVPNGKHP
jgi:tRNA wybutosine-synthesizing protein 4